MGIGFFCLDGAHLVDWFRQHVDQPPNVSRPTGTEIGAPVSCTSIPRVRPSVVDNREAADAVFTKVQRDFKGDADSRRAGGLILFLNHFEGVVNVGQLSGGKLHIYHWSDDLNDFSYAHSSLLLQLGGLLQRFGTADDVHQFLVMAVWRVLL